MSLQPQPHSTPSTSTPREKTPLFLLKTRSVPNDGYEELFLAAKHGDGALKFDPVFVPVLEHKFLEEGLSVVRTLLRERRFGLCETETEGKRYGGLIFTSQRAVEAFAALVEEGKGDPTWPHLTDIPIYTVGPATSRALHSIPSSPPLSIHGSQTGNGEALAHFMLEHYRTVYPSEKILPPVLFLVGEQRRDIIPRTLMDENLAEGNRIGVDELVVYGTGVMESFERDFGELLTKTETIGDGGRDRWVVVFSPTGCEAMLRVLGVLDPETRKVRPEFAVKGAEDGVDGGRRIEGLGQEMKTYVATIGPTTRDYLRNEFGFEPHVCAEKPSPEGVEDGIAKFIEMMNI